MSKGDRGSQLTPARSGRQNNRLVVLSALFLYPVPRKRFFTACQHFVSLNKKNKLRHPPPPFPHPLHSITPTTAAQLLHSIRNLINGRVRTQCEL